ncbi:CsbD family protein [Zavarzinia compransoris]|uniref:CsbD family protein n=1 Tax=Zavarzinia marina TaxID=2911065 RepID=UPI001F34BC12|nr:CsbD family protein [Zavarzinia marina]MCF4165938.1 CsbD family protein [Zavarzinia marina]
MNWDIVKGNWKQIRGQVKERWGDLTDDDLKSLEGQQERLIGRIQERYGKTMREAEHEVAEWMGKLH